MNLNIVLYQPEIPQNTGNIARTCVLTDSTLHLIKPLGFSIDDKAVRRSGLDYWKDLKLEVHESYEEFMAKYGDRRIFLSTTHGGNIYSEEKFQNGDLWDKIIATLQMAGVSLSNRFQYAKANFQTQ